MRGLAGKYEGKEGKKGMMAEKAAEIVGVLFMSRTYAHMAHLATSSYNVHMALNDFYDDESDADFDVTEMADAFAEVAQGKFGKLKVPVVEMTDNVLMPAEGLQNQLDRILELAEGCDGRAMNAIVDQIEELYLGTIYKIKELN
jgi:hypothetical protein